MVEEKKEIQAAGLADSLEQNQDRYTQRRFYESFCISLVK
jgi:hypothetical protein